MKCFLDEHLSDVHSRNAIEFEDIPGREYTDILGIDILMVCNV
jgi:hypothetical protein